jgi:DNA helicase-2/ATP-dependent DNA helicase PcrA
VEEGLLPLGRSAETAEGVEEERRLFYVGLTRAMDRLLVTHVARRWRAGSSMPCAPSSFLEDLPEHAVERPMFGAAVGPPGRRGSSSFRSAPRATWATAAGWTGGLDAAVDGGDFGWRYDPSMGGVDSTPVGTDPEPVYDYSESQEPFELTVGGRIAHPRFGHGTVVTLSGDGMGTKARIEFDESGVKTLLVAHAGLRPAPR